MSRFSVVENTMLALATFVIAIMAGFFYTYSFNVNLAMLNVNGATYATVQSLLNQNVRHLMFFVFFFGGGAVSIAAIITNYKHYKHPSFWLMVIGSVIYISGIIIFTATVNLPLNAYTESWNPQALPTDWEATRLAWNQANNIRVVAGFSAFALYLMSLVMRASTTNTISVI